MANAHKGDRPLVKRPLVTVIVNTFNDASLVVTAIESALSQSWRNLEVLVYNNASADNTSYLVRKISDPRVELIDAKNHTNLSTARNLALESARGEFVCFLDSDDTWHPEKVETQVRAMRQSNLDFCCSNFRFSDEGEVRPPTFVGQHLNRILHSIPFEICYPAALSTIMFKRSVLEGKPFDQSTHITGDYRLVTTLARQGDWKIIPKALVTITRRPSGQSATKVQMMVTELADYSMLLRLDGKTSSSAYVALRALEIGLHRGGRTFRRSRLFCQLSRDLRLLAWLPRYFIHRLRHSRLLTR